MFYIFLIKVPPWAGRASDRWLSAEVQGGSGVKRGIRRRAPALQDALVPTPEAGPLGFEEGRPTGRWRVGGRQVHAWVAKAGLRDGRRVRVGKCRRRFPQTSWQVGCG